MALMITAIVIVFLNIHAIGMGIAYRIVKPYDPKANGRCSCYVDSSFDFVRCLNCSIENDKWLAITLWEFALFALFVFQGFKYLVYIPVKFLFENVAGIKRPKG